MSKPEKETKPYLVNFDGTDEKLKVYLLKTKATGKKMKWSDVILQAKKDTETEEVKSLRATAGYYFAMTCKGTAEEYAEPNIDDPYLIWKALMRRFEDVDTSDSKTLYETRTTIIDEGLGFKILFYGSILLTELKKKL